MPVASEWEKGCLEVLGVVLMLALALAAAALAGAVALFGLIMARVMQVPPPEPKRPINTQSATEIIERVSGGRHRRDA